MWRMFLALVLAYLAGSINFAILVLRLTGHVDPRSRFSGNAGTTNVYRIAGPFWAVVVLLLDTSRAMGVAALAVWMLPAYMVPWAALGLVTGNVFPCFHGFKGGKGVANFLGFGLFTAPLWAGIASLSWVLVYLASKKPFLGSFAMVTAVGIGLMDAAAWTPTGIAATTVTLALIVWAHRQNIRSVEIHTKFSGRGR